MCMNTKYVYQFVRGRNGQRFELPDPNRVSSFHFVHSNDWCLYSVTKSIISSIIPATVKVGLLSCDFSSYHRYNLLFLKKNEDIFRLTVSQNRNKKKHNKIKIKTSDYKSMHHNRNSMNNPTFD